MNMNPDIYKFINTVNPSKEIIINAYVARDSIYNLDNINTRIKHLKKLGFTQKQINKYNSDKHQNYIHKYMNNIYYEHTHSDDFNFNPILNDFNSPNDDCSFNSIIGQYQNSDEYKVLENQIQYRLNRLHHLSNYLNESNKQFYQALTIEELIYLGW
ncbi:hypothetical protein crov093 [Cafeteria roenbergensis virus]|uniref:Uncharacterized protein n=1 Tax=Cafeteria roenbergensis virus (strain BV-PW1) TaxID=693272 RepID=E3T4L3_CROVB|nr:hypothetical protein crov093 [Cafeteria roenbergensis virus BV-PW1]ADO67126.1 hypothetical protein crov093 [Cafeteria roenbergensis virus BV-PW1]